MSQLAQHTADPPSRPPVLAGAHVEAELLRSPRELVRVSTVELDGRRLVELSVWRVRADRGTWFRAKVLRVARGEVSELVLGLLTAARRARR